MTPRSLKKIALTTSIETLYCYSRTISSHPNEPVAQNDLTPKCEVGQIGGADPNRTHGQELSVPGRFIDIDDHWLAVMSSHGSHYNSAWP
jgi:hypothetical protein